MHLAAAVYYSAWHNILVFLPLCNIENKVYLIWLTENNILNK